MVHPERARVWVMGADGMTVQEPPKELPWTESAADVLPSYPFISGEKEVRESWSCQVKNAQLVLRFMTPVAKKAAV